jgi:hypothetical protein
MVVPEAPTQDREVWQIAAGDGARDYRDLFLRFGLAAVGPGWPGPYPEHKQEYLDTQRPEVFRPWLRSFCEDPKPGDLIILRSMETGAAVAVAVGLVTSGYHYREVLEDVEGWNLQHTFDVSWRSKPAGQAATPMPGLNTRGTFAKSHKAHGQAAKLWSVLPDHPKEPLPERARPLSDDQLIDKLVDRGVPTAQAEVITSTIWRLRRLAQWYARVAGYRSLHGSVAEHEIRTFLIVPLLLALGWPEQRIKIEHHHADIVLFKQPFSEPNPEVQLIVETKRLWDALGGASIQQAIGYAEKCRPICRSLIVSDGFRYKLLQLSSGGWRPTAYANLRNLRDRHPTDVNVGGAADLFLALLP